MAPPERSTVREARITRSPREYVIRERHPSYTYQGDVSTGVILPEDGVKHYEVPSEYRVPEGDRYTVVSGRPLLIEARTRRIVDVY